jgi:hypothetical protein
MQNPKIEHNDLEEDLLGKYQKQGDGAVFEMKY